MHESTHTHIHTQNKISRLILSKLDIKISNALLLCVHAHKGLFSWHICEVRGKLYGDCSLCPPFLGFWGLSSGYEAHVASAFTYWAKLWPEPWLWAEYCLCYFLCRYVAGDEALTAVRAPVPRVQSLDEPQTQVCNCFGWRTSLRIR